MSAILRFFKYSLRPKMTQLQIVLFVDGQEYAFERFGEHQWPALAKSIEQLANATKSSSTWFEVEIIEICSCFKKPPPKMYLSCYKEDVNATNLKRPADMSPRQRNKLLDKVHSIQPEQVGQQKWPANLTVKFIAAEK